MDAGAGGDIEASVDRPAPGSGNLLGKLIEAIRSSCPSTTAAPAAARSRGRFADPAAGTGNQDELVFDVRHGLFFVGGFERGNALAHVAHGR